MTISDPSSNPAPKQLWKHVKTGELYEIVEFGIREFDLVVQVIYKSARIAGDAVWVRPAKEFFDGRFVPFTPDF